MNYDESRSLILDGDITEVRAALKLEVRHAV